MDAKFEICQGQEMGFEQLIAEQIKASPELWVYLAIAVLVGRLFSLAGSLQSVSLEGFCQIIGP